MGSNSLPRLDEASSLELLAEIGVAICVEQALAAPGLLEQFNRLHKCNLGAPDHRTDMNRLIDEATGYEKFMEGKREAEMKLFVSFVREYVWGRLANDAKWSVLRSSFQGTRG